MSFSARYDHEGLERLMEVSDYRTFIRLALEIRFGAPGEKGSYTRMSRIAGFSSRSTVREVVTGRKRIAPSSLEKFIVGLGLKGSLREYFALLVAREEEKLNPKVLAREQIDAKLATIRERILRRTTNVHREKVGSILASRDRFAVFAALGTSESGATISEVISRSGVSRATAETALEQLVTATLARKKEERVYPAATHIDFDALGGDMTFEHFFRGGVEQTLSRLRNKPEVLSDRDRLSFESIYSIDRSRMAEFRAQLRALCMQFVDKTERPEGDSLAKLLVAFEPYSS